MPNYYVTTTGAGGHTGANEANAFTMEEACDNVAAGDTVHVKANADYTAEYDTGGAKDAIMYIITAGTAGARIRWIGYHTVITDGGIVTIDAGPNTLKYPMWINAAKNYNTFENFEFNANSVASSIATYGGNADYQIFKRCSWKNAIGAGVNRVDNSIFIFCRFINNGEEGYYSNTGDCIFACCIFSGNGKEGCEYTNNPVFFGCVFFDNGKTSDFKHAKGNITTPTAFIACTFDGENEAASMGLDLSSAAAGIILALNCIIYDHSVGIDGSAAMGSAIIGCLFNSNTNDFVNILPVPSTGDGIGDDGNVSAAPGFTNEGADDYTLAGGSAALDAGFDADFTTKFWASFDGAVNPPVV